MQHGEVAAELLVFAFIKNLDLGGTVGVGKNLRRGIFDFEGNFGFGGIFKSAGRAQKTFAGFGEPVVNRLAVQERVRSAIAANDFY